MSLLKNKTNDILIEKTKQLETYKKDADDAVSLITKTMNRMKSTNKQIEGTMKEIDEYCEKLIATRKQLNESHAHNEKVISNFSKLLCVEEEVSEDTENVPSEN